MLTLFLIYYPGVIIVLVIMLLAAKVHKQKESKKVEYAHLQHNGASVRVHRGDDGGAIARSNGVELGTVGAAENESHEDYE